MKKNFALKMAILSKFGNQIRFAEEVQISELRISKLIHGRAQVTPEEIKIISQKLGVQESEIFPPQN